MIIPTAVGITNDNAVHFQLPVSFLIVHNVVAQGKWMSENSIVQTAVIHVHPLLTNKSFKAVKLSISIIYDDDIYAIIMIGTTISFAGKPKINANRITPSRPNCRANGSRKSEMITNNVWSCIVIFANNQINAPAGIATLIARPSTNNVRSNIERTITFANCGLRYGGNSNVKADGTPFNI